jgi:hypothetical protein
VIDKNPLVTEIEVAVSPGNAEAGRALPRAIIPVAAANSRWRVLIA